MGIVNGFLGIGEQFPHLFLRFYIILAAIVAQTVLIGYLLASLNAQQNIMGGRILRQNIVDIVGGHQLHGKLAAHTHQPLVYRLLGRNAMILQL